MPQRFAPRASPQPRKGRCAPRKYTHPRLEVLEDRTLPAAFDLLGGVATFLASTASSSQITLSQVGTHLVLRDDAETISLGAGAQAAGCTGGGTHEILCPIGGFIALDIVGGNGSDRFTILGTGAAPTFLVTGSGANVVDVEGTSGALTISGTGGADTVTVGAPGPLGLTLANIAGPVSVTNVTATTDLIIDDSGDRLATQATLVSDRTAGQVSSDIQTPLDQLLPAQPIPVVAKFVPAPVNFVCGGVHSLTVRGGGGGNRFVVAGTGPFPTELDSGVGQDDVTILATLGALRLDGQNGRDAVRVGRGPTFLEGVPIPGSPLAYVRGAVTVVNDHSRTDLVVDDGAAPVPGSLTLTSGRIGTLASADVVYAATQLESLTAVGAAGDAFTVDGTPAGATTVIETGAGDPVNLRATTGPLRVVDADGSARIANPTNARFQHVIGRGPLALPAVMGVLAAPTDADLYVLQVTAAGTFSARLQGSTGFAGRLDLLGPESFVDYYGVLIGGGGLLLSEAGQPALGVDPSLGVFLLPGTYYLQVSAAGGTAGPYDLDASLLPGADPFVGRNPDPALNRTVGTHPVDVIVRDFNGDGILDLATVNQGSADVSVLLGIGDGTFAGQTRYHVGGSPDALAALNFNNDGRLDLAVRDGRTGLVTIMLGLGDGTFFPPDPPLRVSSDDPRVAGLFRPAASAVGDFNRDGVQDVAALVPLGADDSGPFDDRIAILIGAPVNPQGTVATPVGLLPLAGFVGDHIKLISASITSSPSQAAPLFADLNGDAVPDVVTVSRGGDIIFRAGLGGDSGGFDAPELVNPGTPARAVALVSSGPTAELAAIDLFSDSLTLYRRGGDKKWVAQAGPATGPTPSRIVAADLDGDGHPDLVVGNDLFGLASLSIYRGAADGTFAHERDVDVGTSISDIVVADVNHDGRRDLLVANPDSDIVDVLLNDGLPAGQINFANAGRWRSGVGLYGDEGSAISLIANGEFLALGLPSIFPSVFFGISVEETQAVAAADFFGTGESDLIVANRGTDNLTLLRGQAAGVFASAEVVATGPHPVAVAVGDFDRDGRQDLAVLMQGTGEVWLFRGDRAGHFTHTSTVAVGANATGLAEVAGSGPGRIDLLIDDEAGDILRLKGDGHGTFTPPVLRGNAATLDTQYLPGSGQPIILVANQSANRVTVQEQTGGAAGFSPVAALAAGNPGSQLAPGDVKWAPLEGKLYDAVVMGTGSNNLLVYHTLGFDAAGNPIFGPPTTYAVGTAPVSVTIQDINGDGVLDMLVANKGSNDVSVLFGSLDAAGEWVATPGPRLKSGGLGPLSAGVRDIGGQQVLVVTNGVSGTVTLLPSRGLGFFDDRTPQVLSLPGPVVQPPSFQGLGGVTVTAVGQVVRFDLDQFGSVRTVSLPGPPVTAAALLADGSIVAAESGEVMLLRLDQGTGAFESPMRLVGATGDPLAPGALEVLRDGRVLVTSQGEDNVFVFSLGLTQPALPGLSTAAAPVASAAAFEEGALVLTVTLAAPSLTSIDQEEGQPGAAATAFLINPAGPPLPPATGRPAEEVEVVARSEGFEWSPDWLPGVDEALRRLQLYSPPEEIPAQVVGRATTPEGPDLALASLVWRPWLRFDDVVSWQMKMPAAPDAAEPDARPARRADEVWREIAAARPTAADSPLGMQERAGAGVTWTWQAWSRWRRADSAPGKGASAGGPRGGRGG